LASVIEWTAASKLPSGGLGKYESLMLDTIPPSDTMYSKTLCLGAKCLGRSHYGRSLENEYAFSDEKAWHKTFKTERILQVEATPEF
jgi:hypothetical protein